MLHNLKVLLVALVIIGLAGGAYAFAATNTVADSAGGYGAKVVSGYNVTGIVYDLNDSDPTEVDAIKFSISPSSGSAAAALVKIQTVDGGSWIDCTLAAGTAPAMNITCSTTGLALEDVTALNVVASSSIDPAP